MVARLAALVLAALAATAALEPPAESRWEVGGALVVLAVLVERGLRAATLGAWDEYGPLDLDDEAFSRLLRGVRARDRRRASWLRALRGVRASVESAFEATSEAVAERRMEAAERALDEAVQDLRPAWAWRRGPMRRLARDRARFESTRHARRARVHLERAARLESERGRAAAEHEARRALVEGLADPGADRGELLELARAQGLEPGGRVGEENAAGAEAAVGEQPRPQAGGDPRAGSGGGAARDEQTGADVQTGLRSRADGSATLPALAGARLEDLAESVLVVVSEAEPRVAEAASRELRELWAARLAARGERGLSATLDPDPEAAREQFSGLVAECVRALLPYARRRRRERSPQASLAALAALPDELLARDPRLSEAREVLARAVREGRLEETHVRALWGTQERLSRRDAERFAELAQRLGVGLDPDPRLGDPPWRIDTVLAAFPLDPSDSVERTEALDAARLALDLAAAVAAADGVVTAEEHDRLEQHLASFLGLAAPERARLRARLARTAADPPGLRGVRRKLEALGPESRGRLASFLLGVALADGTASPEEVRLLQRVWPLLGRAPEKLHEELHELATGTLSPEDGSGRKERGALALDQEVLAAKAAETRAVAQLLGEVLGQEDEPEAGATPASVEAPEGGLDPAHAALARALGGRERWTAAEVEALARDQGLLASGALDVLNEHAYEVCDAPLWEGGDPIEVDLGVLGRIAGT